MDRSPEQNKMLSFMMSEMHKVPTAGRIAYRGCYHAAINHHGYAPVPEGQEATVELCILLLTQDGEDNEM